MIMGWLNIYAAVFSEDHVSIFDTTQRYGMQLIWILAAILIAIIVLSIDTRFYYIFANYLYWLVILILILVLFFGVEVNASKSWIQLGTFRIQPAEFAKFVTALALARAMSIYGFKLDSINAYLKIATIVFIPVILILLQRDIGTTMVFSAFILVLYREGMPGWVLAFFLFVVSLFILVLLFSKFAILAGLLILTLILFGLVSKRYRDTIRFSFGILGLAALLFGASEFFDLDISSYYLLLIPIGIGIPFALIYAFHQKLKHVLYMLSFLIVTSTFSFSVDYIFNNVLASHHRDRINDMLGIESDPLGWGYNVNQSKIAIGSGGLYGKGFLNGTQTKYNFVPEQSTDFIFCTVGEEWGFIGSLVVISLFAFLLLRLIKIAERQREAFSRIYGYGVISILFFHIAVNIGMTIGLFPVIGIPLPFFSYGGSSLWSFTILLFIFLKLDSSRMD
jgi:rod shape determining protein RodA